MPEKENPMSVETQEASELKSVIQTEKFRNHLMEVYEDEEVVDDALKLILEKFEDPNEISLRRMLHDYLNAQTDKSKEGIALEEIQSWIHAIWEEQLR